MTATTVPTIDSLQAKIAKLERDNADLVDAKLEVEEQLDNLLEEEKDTQSSYERVADQLRQIAVDHHDEQRHRGSQRFCTEAPCPALNSLLDGGDL